MSERQVLPQAQDAPARSAAKPENSTQQSFRVSILTGGADKPYALGLSAALMSKGLFLDFVGSDDINGPHLHGTPQVNFLNLRGDQSTSASRWRKAWRVLRYYARLIVYAAFAKPKLFHILWNNKFELFDRTLLMLYYRLLGKKVVFTAHNVNAGKRDLNDSALNRATLRLQYRLANHIFVHTDRMRRELDDEFGVGSEKVTVIPFGINNTLPDSALTGEQARKRLGITPGRRTILFFGNIAPYKGLDSLLTAVADLKSRGTDVALIIAGRPKGCEPYWKQLLADMDRLGIRENVFQKIDYIPDEEVEIYCKAADVLILPYTHVFQSGVLFVGYNFGLPVIATDVGSLREEIIEGRTGLVCRPNDPVDLARAIEDYFNSDLYRELTKHRADIRRYANDRYSWDKVAELTCGVYAKLLAA